MVAGQDVFTELHRRAPGSADLPIKAIQGLLEGGPIHRSGVLAPCNALIFSISGDGIDRAVAIPPTIEFLRIVEDGGIQYREFRLYERFRPRFKQTFSAILLQLAPAPASGSGAGAGGGGSEQQ